MKIILSILSRIARKVMKIDPVVVEKALVTLANVYPDFVSLVPNEEAGVLLEMMEDRKV